MGTERLHGSSVFRDSVDTRDLAKLLMECRQDIPECLEQFKPEIPPNAPLFEEDDEDEDPNNGPAPDVAQGAAWDAGDNSVVFQGDGIRRLPPLCGLR